MRGELSVGLSAVIVAVTEEVPRILTVERSEWGRARHPALPFGPLDPLGDRTLELGLRGWVREQTGLELGYVEQLYTFGDRDRADRPVANGASTPRILSVAYLALVRESEGGTDGDAAWRDAYRFLPWEDWRAGRPRSLQSSIEPALRAWASQAEAPGARAARTERLEIAFGLGRSRWDAERVLDRYQLLYEAKLVAEAVPDGGFADGGFGSAAMAVDHRRILATALGRLRGKLKYRPVVFELMPAEFTLFQLQHVVEALSGMRLHKQNFRRLVERGGLVEGTGRIHSQTGGRPAELFRFRREVLRERPAPGVGLPAVG
ncbi:MAG TPA: hypothetical protein VMT85_03285 [Thermoanaerobaculia bacterium]|nr:hypothetical protein [Thermoanaerobaculia bacterium]